MKYAGFWRQLGAVIIDQLIVLLPSAVIPEAYFYISVANGQGFNITRYHADVMWFILSAVLLTGYYVILNGRYGVTLGRRIMNIKLVRLDQPNRDGIGYLRAAVRGVLFVAIGGFFRATAFTSMPFIPAVAIDAITGVTVFWLLLDSRRRTLEDLLAGTLLVHDPTGKFKDFDPDALPSANTRRFSFAALVIVNALASIFLGLSIR